MRYQRSTVGGVLLMLCATAQADSLTGTLTDLNGRRVAGASITVAPAGQPGPTALTVFSDAQGRFTFPDRPGYGDPARLNVTIRALGHQLLDVRAQRPAADRIELTLLAQPTTNQADMAPASAWLRGSADRDETSSFVLDCMGCHQSPMRRFRDYANAIADVPGTDRADISRRGFRSLIQYMNYISAWEFGRNASAHVADAGSVYSVGHGEQVVEYLARRFPGRMNELGGYDWGAPLIVTPRTRIAEYEVPRPNAVREAVVRGSGRERSLYVADVSSNTMFRINVETGAQSTLQIPHAAPFGPHSLHKAADGSLWATPFFPTALSHLDVKTQQWRTWPLKARSGEMSGIHDLSFTFDHVVRTDEAGRVWFSDIVNTGVGYLDPKNGQLEIYRAPATPGRSPSGQLYGLAMTPDRKELWYTQLAIGQFGSFNIASKQFEVSVVLPANSGPRRMTINDQGVLYVPLFGAGQLVEYDTRSRKLVGTYDLPDRSSAPYAATWDPVRKVVWIPTSNADAIYRFDPRDKSFGVLPMPRQNAYLRMIDVDDETGELITSYANIVENSHGPRMALVIDPGDGAYAGRARSTPGADAATGTAPVWQAAPVAQPIALAKPAPVAPVGSGPELADRHRCTACHDLDKPLIGPPYRAIAARYQTDVAAMTEVLTRKVLLGGGGNWGVVPMVPNEHVGEADARLLASWILSQKP
ncbi:MAG: carboxypeptidase regulatory-like domain-containing protein [Proteobacteria bacterium]|nr:carboxypeptidase regulatory-like domain-containing protein [Pseudomonadota bacterium]